MEQYSIDRKITMNIIKRTIFNKIIDQELVYTVFQPIVVLDTRKVFAYEALSRISGKQNAGICISDLFKAAEAYGEMWTLDKLCRKKALKAAKNKPDQVKLFLNVDGNVMHEKSFVEGFTKKRLEKYGMDPRDIVFEITERSEVDNYKALINMEEHYRHQGYEIAIDDVGSGYSNLNRIVYTNPEYLKIDMELVREIDKCQPKQAIVKSLVYYSNETGSRLIAEGIESVDECNCLKELGIQYGQGYLFGKPSPDFGEI